MTLSAADLSPAVRSDLLAAVRLVGVVNGRTVVDGVPIGSAPVTTEDSARLQPGLAGALYSRWFAGWWPPSGWTPQTWMSRRSLPKSAPRTPGLSDSNRAGWLGARFREAEWLPFGTRKSCFFYPVIMPT